MYLHCTVGGHFETTLVDLGCFINIISRQLYYFIPYGSKFDFRPSNDEIIMADNYSVGVEATARVLLDHRFFTQYQYMYYAIHLFHLILVFNI